MTKFLLLSLFLSFDAFSQESGGGINFFSDILGRKGILVAVGLIFFIYSYQNSLKLFAWIEDQTFGTRDYIMQRLSFFILK